MTRIIFIMLSLCAIVYLALYSVHQDSNYVVLGVGQWVVRTSLTVFVVLLAAAFVPLYLAFRGLFVLLRSPKTLRGWRLGRRYKSGQSILEDGLLALAEGYWKTAESQLTAAAEKGANPVVSYVFAARAAQHRGAFDRRDEYLNLAAASQHHYSVAVGLSRAGMQIESAEREQALASLIKLRAESPSHKTALQMLHRLYEDLGDWDALYELVPAMRNLDVYDESAIQSIEARCYHGRLAAAAGDQQTLESCWESIPKLNRMSPELVEVYVEARRGADAGEASERVLRGAINHQWSESLVRLFGVTEGDAQRQLKTAETWYKIHSSSPALLLALGHLSLRNRLWGKARAYLEESLALAEDTGGYLAMCDLLLELGEPDEAAKWAQRGLRHAAGPAGAYDATATQGSESVGSLIYDPHTVRA